MGFLLAGILVATPAVAQSTTLVSRDSAGVQGNDRSSGPCMSVDGRYVAYASWASNLVPGDTNGAMDVFLLDLQTGVTSRPSTDSAGLQGNGHSFNPSLSANGRFLVFTSEATNLVLGDTNDARDIFLHDRQTGQTTRVSLDSAGVQADNYSESPDLSADGRTVAFMSYATNLAPGGTVHQRHIYVRDFLTGQTSRVSVDSAGVPADGPCFYPSISADGSQIASQSLAISLVPGDMNYDNDIFVHDRRSGQTVRTSVDSSGIEGNRGSWIPSISADGRTVSFASKATNLVSSDTNNADDVFVHDRQTGQTSRVSVDAAGAQGNADSNWSSLSANGGIVLFYSESNNLVPGDSNGVGDVFIHHRQTGEVSRVSVDSAGMQANGRSIPSNISASGRYLAFMSEATNLLAGDLNGTISDGFIHDRSIAGPSLSKTGSCPGAIFLTMTFATSSSNVILACGPAGIFVRPTQPCLGLVLGITPPALTVVLTADSSGNAVFSFHASLSLCGRGLQGIDIASCSATNVIVL